LVIKFNCNSNKMHGETIKKKRNNVLFAMYNFHCLQICVEIGIAY
jgi:hypothetical protein